MCGLDVLGVQTVTTKVAPAYLRVLKRAVMAADIGAGEINSVLSSASSTVTDRDITLMILACKKNRNWRKALEIFRFSRTIATESGKTPSFFTFSATLSVCCRARKVEEALNLLNEMRLAAEADASLEPDAMVYRHIISCCVHEQKYVTALQVYTEMCKRGTQADDQTLARVITACIREKQWNEGTNVIDKVHARGGLLKREEYQEFIEACSADGNLEVVTEVFLMMQMAGVEPGGEIVYHVMQAIEDAKCPLEGTQLLESLLSGGEDVSMETLLCLIRTIHSTESYELLQPILSILEGYEDWETVKMCKMVMHKKDVRGW